MRPFSSSCSFFSVFTIENLHEFKYPMKVITCTFSVSLMIPDSWIFTPNSVYHFLVSTILSLVQKFLNFTVWCLHSTIYFIPPFRYMNNIHGSFFQYFRSILFSPGQFEVTSERRYSKTLIDFYPRFLNLLSLPWTSKCRL